MPIRPLNTLTLEEVIQLIRDPAFYECFEFVYDMYYLRRRFVQFATTGDFAVHGPPAPVFTPYNDPRFGRIAAPVANFGTLNALPTAGPISDCVVTQAAPIPQHESNAMSWDQLYGGGNDLNQGAGAVAPFDIEAAPMGPGINVGQDQTVDSLTHNYNFTPAQAALPQLTDLATTNDNGMNADWDSLFTAMYSSAAQDPSYDPLSPAQTQTPVMSPVSDCSMGDASSSNSSLFSARMDAMSDVHEESSSDAEYRDTSIP